MSQRRYRSVRPTAPAWVRTAVIMLGIFFVFLAFVALFRRQDSTNPETFIRTSDDIVAELTEDGVATQKVAPTRETSRGIPESAPLLDVSGGSGSAIAKRVFENGFFTHTILARSLPLIETSSFHYQAWLIRPYPFDFFETSRLVYNADGSWGMIWTGETGKTYDEFIEVLITLEPNNDFDENPSANQILKGAF